jgi:hypothetical protein
MWGMLKARGFVVVKVEEYCRMVSHFHQDNQNLEQCLADITTSAGQAVFSVLSDKGDFDSNVEERVQCYIYHMCSKLSQPGLNADIKAMVTDFRKILSESESSLQTTIMAMVEETLEAAKFLMDDPTGRKYYPFYKYPGCHFGLDEDDPSYSTDASHWSGRTVYALTSIVNQMIVGSRYQDAHTDGSLSILVNVGKKVNHLNICPNSHIYVDRSAGYGDVADAFEWNEERMIKEMIDDGNLHGLCPYHLTYPPGHMLLLDKRVVHGGRSGFELLDDGTNTFEANPRFHLGVSDGEVGMFTNETEKLVIREIKDNTFIVLS